MRKGQLITVIVALCIAPITTHAQRIIQLTTPAGKVNRAFSNIGQIAELRDGRVLVHDRNENTVMIVGAEFKDYQPFIKPGNGPAELPMAGQILVQPDGGVLITSAAGDRRVVRVDAAGKSVTNWTWPGADACVDGTEVLSNAVRAIDRQGRMYVEAQPIRRDASGKTEVAPMAAVGAYRTPCVSDTVAYLAVKNYKDLMVMSGRLAMPRPETLKPVGPFPQSVQWTLNSLDKIVVVESDPYRAHVFETSSRERTAVIAFRAEPVTDAIKEAWREDRKTPRPATMRVRGQTGSGFALRAMPFNEPDSWPKVLPPLLANALVPSIDGTVWIQRTTANAANSQYDVIDGNAALVAKVSLNPHSRVLAISRKFVYVARSNDDGEEVLERFSASAAVTAK